MATKAGGKSKKGKQTNTNESKYKRQQMRTVENKVKAWKKYLAENPKDEQNKKVIEKLLRGAK